MDVRFLGDGSVAAAEGRFVGTHAGVMELADRRGAGHGRKVECRMSCYEVRGDELASEHLCFDQLDLLGQLGLLPS